MVLTSVYLFEDVTDIELTECQRLRQEQQHANRAGQPILQCTLDGRFNPIQCDAMTRNCWCVDLHGRQVPGTTRPWTQKPDCTLPG
jgi:Thyroglobulin type-1 repeat